MTLSLTARLLCAADHAYVITKDGVVPNSPKPPDPTRSSLVGYLAPAAGACAGFRNIDAVLIGETDHEIILSFRGTLPFTPSGDSEQIVLDWLNDLNAPLVHDPNMPGLVHSGFIGSLNNLWPELSKALLPLLHKSPAKPLCIAGHSKGGALANLAAIRAKKEFQPEKIVVRTFAGARPGDQAFVVEYNRRIPDTRRYEFQDDIVPHLPPSNIFGETLRLIPALSGTVDNLHMGYESAGELQFIDWDKKIKPYSLELKFERYKHIGALLLAFNYKQIKDDHSIDPGYFFGVTNNPTLP